MIFIICLVVVTVSFAAESETACVRSMDSSQRLNPKMNLQIKSKTKRPSSATAQ